MAVFIKAFAIVARDRRELRRCYVPLPRPQLYEHPKSVSAVLVERDWDGEKALLAARIDAPDRQSLAAIDGHLRHFASAPAERISDFRQLMHLGRLPAAIRRFVFWQTLSLSGNKRCRRFGTNMVSSLGSLGAEQGHPVAPVTSYLTFGPIENGTVNATIIYDHRVMDGRSAARALQELEVVLNGEILAELEQRTVADAA